MNPFAHRRRGDVSTKDPLRAVPSSACGQNHVTEKGRHIVLSDTVTALSGADSLLTSPSSSSELSSNSGDSLPPPVSFILQDIRAHTSTPRASDRSSWTEYQLGEYDWGILRRHLEECGDRLRYEYFPRTQTFVHEMPSYAHEVCAFLFSKLVFKKLEELCTSPEEREFGTQFLNGGSSDVEPRPGKNKGKEIHQQDSYLHHPLEPDYGLVIEVAYSQKRDRLSEKAKFYILESERVTPMVIGIDYDYGRTKKVTLLTWRRNGCKKRLTKYLQDLRNEDGALILGDPLQLSMFDLAPREIVPFSMQNKTIEISVQELCAMLQIIDVVQVRREGRRCIKAFCNDDDEDDKDDDDEDSSSKLEDRRYPPPKQLAKDAHAPQTYRSPIKTRIHGKT